VHSSAEESTCRAIRRAEIIVDYLLKEPVPYLFGVCGHGIIGLLDAAFDRRDRIKTITGNVPTQQFQSRSVPGDRTPFSG
jgi:hypothetical protein